jgi:hypothetical protein
LDAKLPRSPWVKWWKWSCNRMVHAYDFLITPRRDHANQ